MDINVSTAAGVKKLGGNQWLTMVHKKGKLTGKIGI